MKFLENTDVIGNKARLCSHIILKIKIDIFMLQKFTKGIEVINQSTFLNTLKALFQGIK
jgi:hypothetical protein